MSGRAALVFGVSVGLALLVGYAVSLLWRYRAMTRSAAGGAGAGGAARRRRGRLGRGWRAAVLVVFSLVAAFALVGVAELGCRVAGYGGYPATFRSFGDLGDGRRLVMTDHGGASSYFFAERSRPGSLDRDALVMPKPAGTFRVMMVGGSAAKGIPYPRHLAGASFLEEMLGDLMPSRQVEVVNLGTTAIASYPVLGMMTESLRHEPDLVVVYCGNNEYYGAYGVASLHSAGRSPGSIRLTRWARSLGVTQFAESLRPGFETDDARTLMEAVVGEASIEPGGEMRAAASRNLRAFVGEMIDRCEAAGVPVIVCTPPVNERGLAPLGEDTLPGVDAEVEAGFAADLARAEAALERDPGASAAIARRLIEAVPTHARAHWVLGRSLDALGDHASAAGAFARSVDLDPMPWRAPGDSDAAIRGAAADRGAVLCDLVAAFRAASPGGSTGWELMDDHVHPSLAGQALIGREIAARVPDAVPGAGFTTSDVSLLPGSGAYVKRLGATVYDTYAAAHAMRVLGRIPFFERTNPQYLARFEAICGEIEASASPEIAGWIEQWRSPPPGGGVRRPITGVVAMGLFERGRYAEAEPLFIAASRAVEPYGTWALQYVNLALTCRGASRGRLDEDDLALASEMIERGRFLVENGYSTTGVAERYVGELHLLRGEFAEAIAWLLEARPRLAEDGRVAVDGALVRAYSRSGQRGRAEAVISRGLEAGGRYAPYYLQMRAMLQ